MPPLNEGTLYYMPTALPGMSITQAQHVLQMQDRIFKSFPEVEWVFGKTGTVRPSDGPAPLSMMENTSDAQTGIGVAPSVRVDAGLGLAASRFASRRYAGCEPDSAR